MFSIKETPEGIVFPVRVLPRSSRNEIAGVTGDALKVKLTAPPVEGAANKLLIEFLSEKLHVAKSRVEILSGQSGRNKLVKITGIEKEKVLSLLTVSK